MKHVWELKILYGCTQMINEWRFYWIYRRVYIYFYSIVEYCLLGAFQKIREPWGKGGDLFLKAKLNKFISGQWDGWEDLKLVKSTI